MADPKITRAMLEPELAELRERCTDPTISRLFAWFLEDNTGDSSLNTTWKQSSTGRRLAGLDGQGHLQILFDTFTFIIDYVLTPPVERSQHRRLSPHRAYAARDLAIEMLRRPLPYGPGDLELLLRLVGKLRPHPFVTMRSLLRAVGKKIEADHEIIPSLRDALIVLRDGWRAEGTYLMVESIFIREADLIDEILETGDVAGRAILTLQPGEAWSDAALAELEAFPAEQRAKWADLLLYAGTAEGSKPSKKWLKRAGECIDAVGRNEYVRIVSNWMSLVPMVRTQRKPFNNERYTPDPNLLIEKAHVPILKGLAWSSILVDDPVLARSLGDAGCNAFKKVPMHGARCIVVANAIVVALSEMKGDEAIAQLGRVNANIKKASSREFVNRKLRDVASRMGKSVDDLAELAVPIFGLDESGKLRRSMGDFTAEIEIVGGDDVKLHWIKSDGKVQKSLPVQIKRDHAGDVKELNRTVKDIRAMLPMQRVRIERLLMSRRQLPLEQWRSRYIDHPLVGSVARRLIWEFITNGRTETGVILNGKVVDANDEPLAVGKDAQVFLWHPIQSSTGEVIRWRQWLETHEITQPFKQAHREIYVLTDAERQTATYSNRFAAHILRQHQLAALGQPRGWTYRLQGTFDGWNAPTLKLPQFDLRVEYWVESAGGSDVSDAGIYMHVATDQLRFYRLDAIEPMNLADVDPLLFSEILRDVDLFVGVASIGNDPQWRDSGNELHFGYWNNYSFGALAESAKTRKAVLERLVPRLKIASRCSFDDRYLVVRGDRHSYKSHLGSGNIRIAHNDQYLCIVPDRSADAKGDLFLPFEGDSMLSAIISKAFLLANDTAIKDRTILSQLPK